jgi:hypothetical protein
MHASYVLTRQQSYLGVRTRIKSIARRNRSALKEKKGDKGTVTGTGADDDARVLSMKLPYRENLDG